jgi:signal transduction histidine kinase
MSESRTTIETLQKQVRVLQRKLERSEWHRVDLENQHDRDQHLYRRLQADLEAAKREARIEAALERVRSRTMAMQHSDELPEAANLLFEQIKSLGMPTWSAGYCIWDEDRQGATQWVSTEGKLLPSFWTSLTEDPTFIHMREAYGRGQSFYVEEVGGTALAQHYEYMSTLPVVGDLITALIDDGHPLPTVQINHCAYFSHGFLLFITYEPVPEAHPIFQRFAKVFEQTYTRFLDLLRAEAQAREARIEAALERVRSRTMAMQHSDELGEVSRLLNQEVRGLGIDTWGCAFNIYGEDASTEWFGTEAGPMPTYPTPREDFFLRFYENGQTRETLYVEAFEGDDCKAHYDYLRTLPVLGDRLADIEAAGHALPSSQIDHVAYFKYGYLLFITREPAPEAHDVFRRFAKVFEQTYTRYLDLEQAEGRAREAQIEAAMERVRSRALAMTRSNELLDVALKIRQEFAGLGLPCGAFWHTRYTPECYQKALTSVDGQKLAAIMELPRDFASYPALAAWERGDEKIGVFPFEADAACQYHHHMVTKGKFFEVDPEAITQEMIREHGGWTFVQARTSHGEIGYSLWGESEPSEEAKDVLVRFTSAFDLAYRRFEDLQQAEADHRSLLEEKALTEQTLVELRATQAQLIQSEKMASLGALTAGIAHEIKNPLNFVNNFAELSREIVAELEGETDPDERRALLADLKQSAAKIEEHGRRADAIVRAMMAHARSGSGERQTVALNGLVEEYAAHALHARKVRHSDLKVTLDLRLDPEAGAVEVVPQEIGRVLINLIDNALDAAQQRLQAMPGGYVPEVTVATRRTTDGVAVCVSDNGPGIAPEIQRKVFEPFFTTKPSGEGTGLGLSMSYDIVTQGHGGTLTVESAPEKGAQFTLTLPAAPPEPTQRCTC